MAGPRSAPVERAFHAWLAAHLPAGRSGALPLGDDVAAVPLGGDAVGLLTTDALTEGTHFLPGSPPAAVGAACAAASLSDLAAKGGRPVALLLDLLLPAGAVPWARAVVAGAERLAAAHGAHVVGGDTKPASARAVVGTAFGIGSRRHLPARRDARPGDLIVVTGTVGRGGAAAAAYARRPGDARARRRLLAIEPRVAEGRALAPLVRAMTDTSDGAGEAARLVAAASGHRLLLEEAAIPWAPGLAALRPWARRRCVAFFGGDYELLATVPPGRLASARRRLARLGTPLTVIGRVLPGAGAWIQPAGGGRPRRIPPPAWDPFRPGLPGRPSGRRHRQPFPRGGRGGARGRARRRGAR